MTGDTTNATNDYLELLEPSLSPRCAWIAGGTATTAGPDVVYAYTPVRSGYFTVSLTPFGIYDGMLWVTESNCGDGPSCLTVANNPGSVITIDTASIEGVAGTTYYIGVDSPIANVLNPQHAGAFSIVVH